MDKMWKHDENIVCIHPGWDLFTGWLAIRESWITIFSNTEMIRLSITNTKVRIFDNKIAVVVCLENIQTTLANGQAIKIGIIATNILPLIYLSEMNQISGYLFITMVLL
jgi:hypothetical protein